MSTLYNDERRSLVDFSTLNSVMYNICVSFVCVNAYLCFDVCTGLYDDIYSIYLRLGFSNDESLKMNVFLNTCERRRGHRTYSFTLNTRTVYKKNIYKTRKRGWYDCYSGATVPYNRAAAETVSLISRQYTLMWDTCAVI